jgi:hypothetical protein
MIDAVDLQIDNRLAEMLQHILLVEVAMRALEIPTGGARAQAR